MQSLDLCPAPVRERGHRPIEVGDAQADPQERPGLARLLDVEQRQLPAARMGADQREAVGPLDDVHAEMRDGELGDRIAIDDPQRNVVEALQGHARRLPAGCVR